MTDMAGKVTAAVDARREAIVGTLSDLVRTNTVNPYCGGRIVGSEKPGQLYMERRLRAMGAAARMVDVPGDVYGRAGIVGPAGRDFADRPNLVADFTFPNPGPHVLVFGHMDTVAADDMTVDPFNVARRDGRLYGRGASDDKGGLTTALHAVETLAGLGIPLGGRLTLASVVEEECNGGGAGILAVLLDGLRPDMAVCVDGLAGGVARGGSGVITGHIDVAGKAGHAAATDGVSALEKALVVKRGLDAFKAARERSRPQGLLNIGVFRAGVHPAVIPGEAEMEFNVVYHVDEARASRDGGSGWCAAPLRKEIEDVIVRAAEADPFLREHRPRVTWVKDLPPYEVASDSPLLATVCDAYRDAGGAEPRVDIMNGWTDAAHVPLVAGCEVVNLGCAAPGAAHSADEYVEEGALLLNTKVLALWLARTLGAA